MIHLRNSASTPVHWPGGTARALDQPLEPRHSLSELPQLALKHVQPVVSPGLELEHQAAHCRAYAENAYRSRAQVPIVEGREGWMRSLPLQWDRPAVWIVLQPSISKSHFP